MVRGVKFGVLSLLRICMVAILGGAIYSCVFTSGYYVVRGAIVALCFAFVVGVLVSKRPFRIEPSEVWVFVFAGYATISISWSKASQEVLEYTIWSYVGVACLYVLVRRVSTSTVQWRFLCYTYCAGAITASVLVILNWLSGISFEQSGRYSVDWLNNNYVAYCIATAVPIFVAALFSNRKYSNLRLSVFVVSYAVFLLAVLLTGSRGASGALVAAGFYLIYALGKGSPLRRSLMLLVFLPIGVVIAFLLPPELFQRLISDSHNVSSSDYYSGRDDVWLSAFDYILDNPLAGLGMESFVALNPFGLQAHNLLVGVWVDFGFIGLVLYCLALYYVLLDSKRVGNINGKAATKHVLILVWFPIAMTGVWVIAPPIWIAFALFTFSKFPQTMVRSKGGREMVLGENNAR